MTTIVWLKSAEAGTCKSRYKQRREEKRQKEQQEQKLKRRIAQILADCDERVLKTMTK